MITEAEHTSLQAAITVAETEIAALDQRRRDAIDKAREFNDISRDCTRKITMIDNGAKNARAQVVEYIGEMKRQQTEKIKAARVEAERLAAEAKAAEESAIAAKDAEIAALREQLAAKDK